MTLMPAVLHLAGERAWWLPRSLDRVLPRVDIEGDRLVRAERSALTRTSADLGSGHGCLLYTSRCV